MYLLGQQLRIEFWKYLGSNTKPRLHYWWEATVHEIRSEGILVYMPLGFEFHHISKNRVIPVDHQAYVAFWMGCWYSGGPDLDSEGRVLEYYFNIQTPPNFEEGRIWQYDLELDLKCRADHSFEVFDTQEFEAKRSAYPPDWVENALGAVEQVKALVAEAHWPMRPREEGRDWIERV